MSKRKRITTSNGKRQYSYRYQVGLAIGRPLSKSEHVHHLDGDESNDEWINLALMPKGIHWLLSRLEENLGKITLFNHKGRPYHPVSIRFIVYREESE